MNYPKISLTALLSLSILAAMPVRAMEQPDVGNNAETQKFEETIRSLAILLPQIIENPSNLEGAKIEKKDGNIRIDVGTSNVRFREKDNTIYFYLDRKTIVFPEIHAILLQLLPNEATHDFFSAELDPEYFFTGYINLDILKNERKPKVAKKTKSKAEELKPEVKQEEVQSAPDKTAIAIEKLTSEMLQFLTTKGTQNNGLPTFTNRLGAFSLETMLHGTPNYIAIQFDVPAYEVDKKNKNIAFFNADMKNITKKIQDIYNTMTKTYSTLKIEKELNRMGYEHLKGHVIVEAKRLAELQSTERKEESESPKSPGRERASSFTKALSKSLSFLKLGKKD